MRLGVSTVQHDMKREETVEEVEKNTEWERHTPQTPSAQWCGEVPAPLRPAWGVQQCGRDVHPRFAGELPSSGGLPDTPDCVINPVQMACGLLQLTGGGVQCEAVAHPLGGVTASSSRTERSEMVAWAMISHTWTGTIVFVFMFSFLFDSVFGSVCYCQTRCSFAVGKAIQQTHRTFCCGFAYD